jgi:hypothetical protein
MKREVGQTEIKANGANAGGAKFGLQAANNPG